MKHLFFICIALWICASCVHQYHAKDSIPQHLPKEVPEMVLTEYVGKPDRETDTVSYGSFHCVLSRIVVSKHEVTNKYFCYFLNVDSICNNKELIKMIIDLSDPDSRIYVKDGKYYPLKGYADYPVVRVSWWGAKKYAEWLTAYVNVQREKKGMYRFPNYRLPSEYEWLIACSDNGYYKFPVETICDSIVSSIDNVIVAHNVMLDTVNAGGVSGMDENVYEWTDDNFYTSQYVMDFSMTFSYYPEEITSDALVRKHGLLNIKLTEQTCGRISRKRTGFYSDTGFRIVQTYLGRSTGAEF